MNIFIKLDHFSSSPVVEVSLLAIQRKIGLFPRRYTVVQTGVKL